MAGSVALAFDILARDKASAVFDKVGDKAEKTGGKLSKVGGIASAALGGAAVAGVAAFGAALFQGGKDAVAFQTLTKKSEAVLKSTGNAAGTSVKGIQELAGSLETMSGVDEELIINSQNVLATFTKIKNTPTDKIFDKATASALDMSVALGTDLQSATTMVGKALNDPVKGLTAMSKAGIQFTEEQKEQIKTMVEAGDTMGAQKVILGELETQFGGAAKAAGSGLAGDMARLQDAFGDAFRELATALLPTLTDLAQWLAKHLPGAIEDFRMGLSIVSEFVKTNVVPVLESIGTFITTKVVPAMSSMWDFISTYVLPVLESLATFFVTKVLPALADVVTFVVDDVIPTLGDIITTITNIATTVGEKVADVVKFFEDLATDISTIASTLWGPIESTFKGVINGIIKAWNALDFSIDIRVPGWVPGIGGKGFQIDDVFPDIDELWTGARNYRGGWSMVGERGPELMHVPAGADVFSAPESLRMVAGASGNTYDIKVYNPVAEPASDSVRRLRRAAAGL